MNGRALRTSVSYFRATVPHAAKKPFSFRSISEYYLFGPSRFGGNWILVFRGNWKLVLFRVPYFRCFSVPHSLLSFFQYIPHPYSVFISDYSAFRIRVPHFENEFRFRDHKKTSSVAPGQHCIESWEIGVSRDNGIKFAPTWVEPLTLRADSKELHTYFPSWVEHYTSTSRAEWAEHCYNCY